MDGGKGLETSLSWQDDILYTFIPPLEAPDKN